MHHFYIHICFFFHHFLQKGIMLNTYHLHLSSEFICLVLESVAGEAFDMCNFYMIFIILLFIKLLDVSWLYFFWFDLIFIYIYLFICALKGWEDFRLIYKGFTCKVGPSQLNQANLHPARHEFKRRPTQLNLSPTGARNQRKFAQNPSPIRIRIPACTSVIIFSITFGSDIQSRWFKLGWKVNLKGYNFVVYQKSELWR